MPTSLDPRRCPTDRRRRSGIPEPRCHGAMTLCPPQRCTTAYQENMPGDLSRLYSGRAGAPHRKNLLEHARVVILEPYPALAEEAESLRMARQPRHPYRLTGHPTRPDRRLRICALHFRSNVRNLLPGDFPVFGHAVHYPRWRDQDHEPVLEPHPPRLFRADPARIRRGIDGGDKLLAVVRV
jgi:hypothetical protein